MRILLECVKTVHECFEIVSECARIVHECVRIGLERHPQAERGGILAEVYRNHGINNPVPQSCAYPVQLTFGLSLY